MSDGFKDILNNIIIVGAYLLLVMVTALIMLYTHHSGWWEKPTIVHWDAGWYESIRNGGYAFRGDQASNVAFFPLFPYFWRWMHLNAWQVSGVNILLFCIGQVMLFHHFPAHWRLKMLNLACSLVVFYMIPYSESLFFLFAVFLLIGLKKERVWLVLAGITGIALSRSTGSLFIPAFLLLGCIRWMQLKNLAKAGVYLIYSLYTAAILFLVLIIQYYQTGVWMAFSKAQKFWDSSFRIPDTPFNTWPISTPNNKFIEHFALFIGLISIIYVLVLFVRLVRGKRHTDIKPTVWISLLYLSGVSLLMTFTRGGFFVSINRYVLSTPFLYFFLLEMKRAKLGPWIIGGISALAIVYQLVCWHMGVSVDRLLMILPFIGTILVFPYLLRNNTKLAHVCAVLFAGFTIYAQAALVVKFVTSSWVG